MKERHVTRHHKVAHVLSAKRNERGLGQFRAGGLDHIHQHVVLAEIGGHGDGRHFQHIRVLGDRRLDFVGGYILAPAADRFFLAIDEPQVTLGIERAPVAGVEPQVRVGRRRRLGHLVITEHPQPRLARPDQNFTHLASRQRLIVLVHNGDIGQPMRMPRRCTLLDRVGRRERRYCKRFGRGEHRRDFQPEPPGIIHEGLPGQRNDHALTHGMRAFGSIRRLLEQHARHHAQCVELRRTRTPDVLPEPACRKTGRQRDRRVRPQRGVRRIPECVDVEQRQARVKHVVGPIAVLSGDRAAHVLALCVRTDHAF